MAHPGFLWAGVQATKFGWTRPAESFLAKTNSSEVMKMLRNAEDVTGSQNVHAFCKPIKILSDIGSDMRPLFAILGLLFCVTAIRADELPSKPSLSTDKARRTSNETNFRWKQPK
jgi:hypothetical protein